MSNQGNWLTRGIGGLVAGSGSDEGSKNKVSNNNRRGEVQGTGGGGESIFFPD